NNWEFGIHAPWPVFVQHGSELPPFHSRLHGVCKNDVRSAGVTDGDIAAFVDPGLDFYRNLRIDDERTDCGGDLRLNARFQANESKGTIDVEAPDPWCGLHVRRPRNHVVLRRFNPGGDHRNNLRRLWRL